MGWYGTKLFPVSTCLTNWLGSTYEVPDTIKPHDFVIVITCWIPHSDKIMKLVKIHKI